MKDFKRSLKYLWPYRSRLAISVVCVIFIAALWGGGLGMMLPGAKIMLSSEGLHGWAWSRLAGDRLGMNVVQRLVPPNTTVEGTKVTLVADVIEVDKKSPAAGAGVESGQWILSVADASHRGAIEIDRGDQVIRDIARSPAGARLALRTYNPFNDTQQRVNIKLARANFGSRVLGIVAERVPEPQSYPGRFKIFIGLLIVVLILTVLRDIFRFIQEYLVASAVYRGVTDLRCENYGVVLRLPTTFFSAKGTTDTMSRFVQDTNQLARGQVTLFGKTMAEPGKAIGALAVAFLLSWRLTLVALIAGPPTFVLIRKFGKLMRRASRRALESWSAMLGILEETLSGIRVVKAYTMEGAERKRFNRENRRLLKQQKRMAKINAATSPAVEALGISAAMGASALAGYWVFNRQMDSEKFLTLMALLAALFDPLRKLSKVATRFQRADAAAARVFELHDQEVEKAPPAAPTLPPHSESVEFRNVYFRYPGALGDALKNINLKIPYSSTLAVVGPNGSGKTTMVSLVPRLIDPTAGQVLIDGKDIHEHSIRSLRRQIGLVCQETIIFNATIAENIAYGLSRPRREDVIAAAKKAFVDEFAEELPDGYDTMVGEHGATLSGGQRQRIAIARAILRDPRILIFDEAMSQVDANSERKIHQAMGEFIKDRTTLLIAHRFATVLSADIIAVISNGEIIDSGTHEELLRRCDLYRHLYQTQFADTGG